MFRQRPSNRSCVASKGTGDQPAVLGREAQRDRRTDVEVTLGVHLYLRATRINEIFGVRTEIVALADRAGQAAAGRGRRSAFEYLDAFRTQHRLIVARAVGDGVVNIDGRSTRRPPSPFGAGDVDEACAAYEISHETIDGA